ncbi:MAG TPA: cohesin domain-containing protein [Blastocatellia bacterium]|nr:cohesin domain-containing protein [Blastocatellia bacterium]
MIRSFSGSITLRSCLLVVVIAALLLAIPAVDGYVSAASQSDEPSVSTASAVSSFAIVPEQYTKAHADLPSKRHAISVDAKEVAYSLPPLDDRSIEKKSPNQIGIGRPVGILSNAHGSVTANPDGTRIRLLAIQSPGAIALRVHLESFDLPPGDEVYAYGVSDDSLVAGPYTGRGPYGADKESNGFWTDTIAGDTVIIEHYSRGEEAGIYISELSHIFANIPGVDLAPNVLSCHNDAMCTADLERDAVARIVFTSGGSSFVCTGTMMNNLVGDFAPYFLTANHCVSDQFEARTVEAYWFYRTTACNSGAVSGAFVRTSAGARVLANQTAPDSSLLRIFNTVPVNLVYSGWDSAAKVIGTPVFGLSHPGVGVPPSIESYLRRASGTITSTTTSCGATGLVNGFIADWTSGLTEPGSSGSGLFATDGGTRLVGVLSCGPVTPTCADFGVYGRFSDFYPAIRTFMELGDSTGVCAPTPISIGQTVSGALSSTDCPSRVRGSGYFSDRYSFSGTAGQQVSISLSSTTFDTYLYLVGPGKSLAGENDDGGAPGPTDSRIPAFSGLLTLPATGMYVIDVDSFSLGAAGGYSLTLGGACTSSMSVSSINPTSGSIGSSVTISGNNFTGVTSVRFSNNVNASFTVNSNAQITATVPNGAVTGSITISKPGCPDVATQTFTVFQPPVCPLVNGINPTSGSVGTNVTITGSGLSGITAVTFAPNAPASFVIVSDSQVGTTVPAGAQTGSITISKTSCANVTTPVFTVNPPPPSCPTVSGINPTTASVGSNVTISGNNFTGVTSVRFSNNVNAVFTVNSNTQITATVPLGAITGPITISKTNCPDVQTPQFTIPVGPCIAVSIPTSLTGGSGSTAAVPVNVASLAGQNVVSYDFVVSFNAAVLTPASPPFEVAGTLSSSMTVTPNTSTPGRLTISAFGTSALSGSGTLINLRFNVAGGVGGFSDISWVSFRFNEGTPCAATSNGRLTVGGGEISGTVTYCNGARPVLGVLVSAAGSPGGSATTSSAGAYTIRNLGGGPYTVTPAKSGDVNGISSFDAAQVAQAAAGLITLSSCQQVAGDASNNGSLSSFDASLIAQFAAGISNPGSIAGTWKFLPPNRSYPSLSGSQTGQNFEAVLVGDVSGNWTPPAATLVPFRVEPRFLDRPRRGSLGWLQSPSIRSGLAYWFGPADYFARNDP